MKRASVSFKKRDLIKLRDGAARMHASDTAYRKADYRGLLMFSLAVLVAVFAVKLFFAEPTPISGLSMTPTLRNAERMFIDKTAYWLTTPERGDIITCYYPGLEASRVKRVIGLAGETIEIKDGKVYINGAELDESAYWTGYINNDMEATTIPCGSVFVMGDNRNDSGDSRKRDVGPIPYERIIGKARAVIWPVSEYRWIG